MQNLIFCAVFTRKCSNILGYLVLLRVFLTFVPLDFKQLLDALEKMLKFHLNIQQGYKITECVVRYIQFFVLLSYSFFFVTLIHVSCLGSDYQI